MRSYAFVFIHSLKNRSTKHYLLVDKKKYIYLRLFEKLIKYNNLRNKSMKMFYDNYYNNINCMLDFKDQITFYIRRKYMTATAKIFCLNDHVYFHAYADYAECIIVANRLCV